MVFRYFQETFNGEKTNGLSTYKEIESEVYCKSHTVHIIEFCNGRFSIAKRITGPWHNEYDKLHRDNSDYGPRNVTSGTNPHIGIDYNITAGNNAFAVESGSIHLITNFGNPYTRIEIENTAGSRLWRYVHMEDDTTADLHWEVFQDVNSNNANDIIVQRSGPRSSLVTERVLGDRLVQITNFTDPRTGQNVPVERQVSQGAWIFVANRTPPIPGNHLHLDLGAGVENPLKYIAHRDVQDPIIVPKFKREINGIATDFPDDILFGNSANPIILQSAVDIISDKDLNTSEIILNRWNVLDTLRSWEYEGPGINTSDISVLSSLQAIEDAIEERIYPRPSPGSNTFVSHDFFKFRWNSTTHQSNSGDALINSEAKFYDGKYTIRMEALDIRANHTREEREKVIDNFRPYVKRVKITQSDYTIYEGGWEWHPTNSTLNSSWLKNIFFKPSLSNTIQIIVELSETVAFPGETGGNHTFNSPTSGMLQTFFNPAQVLTIDPLGENFGAGPIAVQLDDIIISHNMPFNTLVGSATISILSVNPEDFFGDFDLVVDARDLGQGTGAQDRGNKLLVIPANIHQIYPLMRINRDNNGNLLGNDGIPPESQKDTYHKFKVDPVPFIGSASSNIRHQQVPQNAKISALPGKRSKAGRAALRMGK